MNEVSSQAEQFSLRRFRVAGLASAVGGGIALLLNRGNLPDGVAASLLTAWGLVIGGLFGQRRGLALILTAAVADGWLNPPGKTRDFVGFAVCWSTTAALSAGIAWQQQRLQTEHRRARLDPLTGLPNRQAFFERCSAELSRAKRFDRPLTVMALDGDDFKTINDRHGHARGDLALQQTARILVSSVRPYDLVCRLGGDEFALIFPETQPEDAERIGTRLMQTLNNQLMREFSPLTYSIGAVTLMPSALQDPAGCLAEADRVLYAAKRAGKGKLHASTIFPAGSMANRETG